ncbi:MAG TPA: carboxypeptidase-like regulatory domain-containing protein, partial [Terriglobia bacterium]|nr:carboxypeptidase-like regulatory domain-containing protein [Terriglobia bacterium]
TGRVRMENGAPPPADLRVNVVLGSSMPPLPTGPRTLQWNSDGTFRIDGIEPGEYRVSISPVRASGAAGVLVREAWSG